jgi:hypothetical protein
MLSLLFVVSSRRKRLAPNVLATFHEYRVSLLGDGEHLAGLLPVWLIHGVGCLVLLAFLQSDVIPASPRAENLDCLQHLDCHDSIML